MESKSICASLKEFWTGKYQLRSSGSKQYQTFTQRLESLENKAYASAFQLIRQQLELFHKQPAEYFEAALLIRSAKYRAERTLAEEFVWENKLDRDLAEKFSRLASTNDPILGPFIALAKNENSPKKPKKPEYHPMVVSYLSSAGAILGDVKLAAVRFAKFCRTFNSSYGSKVNPFSAPRGNTARASGGSGFKRKLLPIPVIFSVGVDPEFDRFVRGAGFG